MNELEMAAVGVLLAWARFVLQPEGDEGAARWDTLTERMKQLSAAIQETQGAN